MFAIIIVLICVVCGAFATPLPSDVEPTIIGGRPARYGEYSYIVSLRGYNNGVHFCAGSIISQDYVLTAAHCVPDMGVFDFLVVVGTIYLNSGGKSYHVAQVSSHSGYNPETLENDIAVIRIIGRIAGSSGMSVINLAENTLPAGNDLTLTGWGLTSYPSNSLPNQLQAITLRSISETECQALMPGYPVFDTHVCTKMASGQGACKGDAGGPLVMKARQYGIVSWGIHCATGKPDVFTSVYAHRDWIRSETGL